MEKETIEVGDPKGTVSKKGDRFDQLRHFQNTSVNIRFVINFFQPASELPIDNLLRGFKNRLILSQKSHSKICIILFSHKLTISININENYLPKS